MRLTSTIAGDFRVPRFVTAQDMERIGARAQDMILQRTTKGVDVAGKAFRAYSPKYEAFRSAAGLQIGHVDLDFSGRMLGSLAYVVEGENRVRLYFPPSEAGKAHGNQFQWGRRFFDLSEAELRKLGAMLTEKSSG